jgi:hypothetical protein
MGAFGQPQPRIETSIDKVPVMPMTESQIAALHARVEAVRELDLPQLRDPHNPHSYLYVMAPDGTGNDAMHDREHITNVGLLNKSIQQMHDPHVDSGYVPGVGNQPLIAGVVDGALGLTVDQQATKTYDAFVAHANQWRRMDQDAEISLAGVGFSRGSAALLLASRMVHERGAPDFSKPELEEITDPLTKATQTVTRCPHYLIPPGEVRQALILNDQVATGAAEDLKRRVPPSVISA